MQILRNTNLSGVNLRHTNFDGATFTSIDFTNANYDLDTLNTISKDIKLILEMQGNRW